MGESAIPLILEKIAAGQQGLWWILLETITGARPDEGITPIEGTKGWVGMDVPTVHAACSGGGGNTATCRKKSRTTTAWRNEGTECRRLQNQGLGAVNDNFRAEMMQEAISPSRPPL